MQSLELATYYLIAVNLLTFALFGYDKVQAERGGWRVAEATLVLFVVLGGIGGAVAGRSLFRHKTRKPSFAARMWTGAVINLCLLAALALYAPRILTPGSMHGTPLPLSLADSH